MRAIYDQLIEKYNFSEKTIEREDFKEAMLKLAEDIFIDQQDDIVRDAVDMIKNF